MKPKLSFQPINRENWQAVAGLSLLPEQNEFLWSNASSLVECLYETEAKMQAYAICADESAIGLLVYGTDSEDASSCFVYHLMIAGKEQGKGYGAAAMRWLIEASRSKYQAIILSYEPENKAASAFYAKLGFKEIGINPDWGEMNAIYRLD